MIEIEPDSYQPARAVLVPYSDLRPDPENCRTKMDEERLRELMQSILRHGVQQNLMATRGGTVVVGNRRLEAVSRIVGDFKKEAATCEDAARKEKLLAAAEKYAPVPVVFLTEEEEAEAREIQMVENLQREDLNPVDEARGYVWFMEEKGLSPEEIGQRIGRSASHVNQRAKVLRAPESMRKALELGEIPVRLCELVGRIPGDDDRGEAAARIMKPQYLDRPLSVREAAELIRKDFMVTLKGAPFDVGAEDLVEGCGSCELCPFRSGNLKGIDAELALTGGAGGGQAKGGVDPWTCTSPQCYRQKEEAGWDRQMAEAREGGDEVLSPAEGKKLFNEWGQLKPNAGYVDVRAKPGFDETGHYDQKKLKTWGAMAKGLGVPQTWVRTPDGKVVRLFKKELVREAISMAAKEKGEEDPFARGSRSEDGARPIGEVVESLRERDGEDDGFPTFLRELAEAIGVQGEWHPHLLTAALLEEYDIGVDLARALLLPDPASDDAVMKAIIGRSEAEQNGWLAAALVALLQPFGVALKDSPLCVALAKKHGLPLRGLEGGEA